MLEIAQTGSSWLARAKPSLARSILDRHRTEHPGWAQRVSAFGRAKCEEDLAYHLSHLSEAVRTAQVALFTDYVAWAKVLLTSRGIPVRDFREILLTMRTVLKERAPLDVRARIVRYVDAGVEALDHAPENVSSFLPAHGALAQLASDYLAALLRADRASACAMTTEAAARGTDVRELYLQVFERTQQELGRLWQLNGISVAEEHYCTAATQLAMAQLYPHMFRGKHGSRVMVAACVAGDLHEIGARMIADFFELEGWKTLYLGANVPLPSLLATVAERKADLVALSATMSFHVPAVAEVIRALREDARTAHVKILVGGRPFNTATDLWRILGADGSAPDARGAVDEAKRLLS